MTELVVESANSGIESSDSTADSAEKPLKIGLWVPALIVFKDPPGRKEIDFSSPSDDDQNHSHALQEEQCIDITRSSFWSYL